MITKGKKWLSMLLVFSLFMANFAYANTDQINDLNKTTLDKMRKEALSMAMIDSSKDELIKYIASNNLVSESTIDGVYHGIFKTEDENTWIVLSEQQLDSVTRLSQSEFKVNEKIYKFEINKENVNFEIEPQAGWTEIGYNPSSSWSFDEYKTIYPHVEDDLWDLTVGVIAVILGGLCGGAPVAGVMIGITALILSQIDFYGYPPSAVKINRYTYTSGWLYRKSYLICYSAWEDGYKHLGNETHYFTKSIGGP